MLFFFKVLEKWKIQIIKSFPTYTIMLTNHGLNYEDLSNQYCKFISMLPV